MLKRLFQKANEDAPKQTPFPWRRLFRWSGGRDEWFEHLEEQLVVADVGLRNAQALVRSIREASKGESLRNADDFNALVKRTLLEAFEGYVPFNFSRRDAPMLILLVGVNGVGKTTCMAKLASHCQGLGRRVLFGAGDTYRAAAFEQLAIWAERLSVPLVGSKQSTDGASVLYDSLQSALNKGFDTCIVDTAGRLENKAPLMEQLRKMGRVVERFGDKVDAKTLLVLDATLGASGYSQAKIFGDAMPLDGAFLTKLDSQSKGGMVVAVVKDLGLPVFFLGHGESHNDMSLFDPKAYVDSLL